MEITLYGKLHYMEYFCKAPELHRTIATGKNYLKSKLRYIENILYRDSTASISYPARVPTFNLRKHLIKSRFDLILKVYLL